MSNWRLNWNVIRPDLIVGSCPREVADLMVLQQDTGATALLSLQHDECLEKQEIDYPRHVRHGHRLAGRSGAKVWFDAKGRASPSCAVCRPSPFRCQSTKLTVAPSNLITA